MGNKNIEIVTNEEQLIMFARCIVEKRSVIDAYVEVYRPPDRWTRGQIWNEALNLSRDPLVKTTIDNYRDALSKTIPISTMEIIQDWIDIASADPNELIQHRRRCCRHCYGENHWYQWIDEREFTEELGKIIERNGLIQDEAKKEPLPDNLGGYGFNYHANPNSNCRKCFGEGEGDVYVADTRFLSHQAKKLYAGVKQTKWGMELLLRDQDDALKSLAKAMGMFAQQIKLKVDESTPLEAIEQGLTEISNNPEKTMDVYKQLVQYRKDK